MGTDIHAFIEIDYSEEGKAFEDSEKISAFNLGELLISRDYELFDALGDGRSSDEITEPSLYGSRGLPKNISFAVENRYFHIVDNRESEFDKLLELHPSLSKITTKKADKWLSEGCSFLGEEEKVWRNNKWENLQRVSHPGWHSCSWLTLKEIYESLAHYDLPVGELFIDFRILLSTMEQFEQELGVGHTRLVFWFDN